MKFVLFREGMTESLAFFSAKIARELERRGQEVLLFDINDKTTQLPGLKQYLSGRDAILLTFNFGGIQREAIFYDEAYRLLWDLFEVRCVNVIVDHPLYYYRELLAPPEHYLQLCIDEGHAKYMRRYYPQIMLGETKPLPGSLGRGQEQSACRPIRERTVLVAFTGNYTPPERFTPYMERNGKEYEDFYHEILEELKRHPFREIDEVCVEQMNREMGELAPEQVTLAMSSLLFLDMAVRFWFRGEVVKGLLEQGIPVRIYGGGWEHLKTTGTDFLQCAGIRTSQECCDLFMDTRLSLNVMPWFKRGSHDRIYNSMRNGAVCVTDTSRFLTQELTDGENVVFYELTELELLPDRIKTLLRNEERLQKIADAGRSFADREHNWSGYTDYLLQEIAKAEW